MEEEEEEEKARTHRSFREPKRAFFSSLAAATCIQNVDGRRPDLPPNRPGCVSSEGGSEGSHEQW